MNDICNAYHMTYYYAVGTYHQHLYNIYSYNIYDFESEYTVYEIEKYY